MSDINIHESHLQRAKVCSLCGGPYEGMGHNPEPVKPYAERCCDGCNMSIVIPARLGRMR